MIKKDSNNNNVYDNSMITTDIMLPWYCDKNNYDDNNICYETTNDDGMEKQMKTKVKIFVAPVLGVTWKKSEVRCRCS